MTGPDNDSTLLRDSSVHIPVMLEQVLELADVRPGSFWIDGTAGGGGHTFHLWQKVQPDGKVWAIDRDPDAIVRLQQRFSDAPPDRFAVIQGSYEDIPQAVSDRRCIAEIDSTTPRLADGVLLDLGLSSDQLADQNRGFSFRSTGELDLRFDTNRGLKAWEWLQQIDEQSLADIIYEYGEERFSRRIAKNIIDRNRTETIKTAEQLCQAIYQCVPGGRHGRIDPATRTFQALRIAVNDELGAIERTLKSLPDYLAPGGKLLIISFHSLEDRLVKHAFKSDDRLRVITKKPIEASPNEIRRNPRSRSAKLRVAERIQ